MNYWSQTMGTFTPAMSDEKHTSLIKTRLNNEALIDAIIEDHMSRSPIQRTADDYRPEDYSDEIRIFIRSGSRWRTLINLQYEGGDEVAIFYRS